MTVEATEALDAIRAGLPPLLLACCDPEPARYDCSTPWRARGWVYATDASIIARVPEEALERHVLRALDAVQDGRPRRPPPNPWVCFDEAAGGHRDAPIALPAVCSPRVPCSECGGGGRTLDPSGVPYPAAWDDWYFCEDCAGTGRWRNNLPVAVAPGYWLAGGYVALLFRHGARCHLPTVYPDQARQWTNTVHLALRFVAGDVAGLAMPMFPPDDGRGRRRRR